MGTRTPPATFAQLLQRHRRAAGLTQEELAERAHLSVRGISNLERGVRRLPQRSTLTLLIEALALPEAQRAEFEAAARGLADPSTATLAVRPALTVPTNLPLALTSFVGREREVAAVRRLLGETRLLTLTGAGGCGKTRLALRVAGDLARLPDQAGAYADGIWLVELAAVGDGALLPQTMAAVLGVRERPGESLLDSLVRSLQPKRALLLLDNCEHLVTTCAALAEALLRVCPRLTALATSREALGIGGELPWRVPSLGLPDARGRLTIERAAACEAVQLFAQRAQTVRPDFALTDHQVILATQICRRLDGIPLAIELAAARLAVLSLDQLAARLDDRFRLLTGGSRTALPRQQTLRATLDWSYELLGEPERLLLQRLSVFAGDWTLEAAEAVCAGESLAPEEVLALLAGLVAKSLVLLEEREGEARYRLLETVRQYGWEKLEAAGEAPSLRDRHLYWYLALAGQAAQGMGGPEQEVWLERLEVELENLRLALAWSSTGQGRKETGLRLAEALRWFWSVRGHLSEGRQWLEGLLAGDVAATLRARAIDALAELTWQLGDDGRALALFEEGFVLHRQAGNGASAAHALLAQGMVLSSLGDYPRARALIDQALPLLREHGERHGVSWSLACLGKMLHLQGEYAQAAASYEESLAIFRDLGDKFGSANLIANIANLARDMGEYERAKRLYRESLILHHSMASWADTVHSFEGLATLVAVLGQPARAASLFGVAGGIRESLGHPMQVIDREACEPTVSAIRSALGEETFEAAWTAGEAMGLEEAFTYALQEAGTDPP
jgi:non-specific serine/threonine protein kinase